MSLASTTLASFKAASTFSAAAASSFAAFERYLCHVRFMEKAYDMGLNVRLP